jgi:signal transduction histidine kinase
VPTIDAWFARAYPGADDNRTVHQVWQRVRSAAVDGAETFHLPPTDRRVVCKDGSLREVIVRLRVFHSKVMVTLQDVTDDRRIRAELGQHRDRLEDLVRERTAELAREVAERRRAEEEARSADRLKSAFLATMSHELRTPLNSILGFTGLLLKGLPGPLNDEQRRQLGMVQSSSRHLLALINDILDLSKIEAGQFELGREPFDLRASVEHTARAVAPLAEKKGLKLHTVFGHGLGPAVGDVRRTEQVLLNLLSNAIKFTDAGEVSVWCEARDGWAVTSVRDTGIGIAAADQTKLFRPFHQLDNGLSRRHEGLVGLMGGTMSVDSEPGRGSAFTFTLPLGPRAEP